jgi:hypothetical protein
LASILAAYCAWCCSSYYPHTVSTCLKRPALLGRNQPPSPSSGGLRSGSGAGAVPSVTSSAIDNRTACPLDIRHCITEVRGPEVGALQIVAKFQIQIENCHFPHVRPGRKLETEAPHAAVCCGSWPVAGKPCHSPCAVACCWCTCWCLVWLASLMFYSVGVAGEDQSAIAAAVADLSFQPH